MAGELSTAGAAEYLRVSEASVRRWADSGMLEVQRLGRRRQRRFREEDLRLFLDRGRQRVQASTASHPSPKVRLGEIEIPPGDHLAAFYDTDAARLRLAVPFIRDGLRLGQLCYLVASGKAQTAILAGLAVELGGELAEASAKGRLIVLTEPGDSPKSALEQWEARFWEARTRGEPLVRMLGDVGSAAEAFGSAAEMLVFEHAFTSLVKRCPIVVLCTYDVRRFNGPTMLEAIKAHPDIFEYGLQHFLP